MGYEWGDAASSGLGMGASGAGLGSMLAAGGIAGSSAGPIGAGAGLTLGLLKYFLVDEPKAERQRKLAAATQRYSPWTGMTAEAPQEADPFSSPLAFGSQGAAFGQSIDAAKNQKQLQEAYIRLLDAQTASRGFNQPRGGFLGDYANSMDNNMFDSSWRRGVG